MKITKLITGLSLIAAVSISADTVYTSESAFIAALQPGYYFNDFSTLTPFDGPLPPQYFSGGTPTISYGIHASPGGLLVNQDDGGLNAVGNFTIPGNMVVLFTSRNVYAVGAEYYFSGNILGALDDGNITLTYNEARQGPFQVTCTTHIPLTAFLA